MAQHRVSTRRRHRDSDVVVVLVFLYHLIYLFVQMISKDKVCDLGIMMDSMFCLIYFIVIHVTFLSSTNNINAHQNNGNVTCVYVYHFPIKV